MCRFSELTGSESPVRDESGAGCLLLTGMVSARDSVRIDGLVMSVSGKGRVRLCGHVNLRLTLGGRLLHLSGGVHRQNFCIR